MSQVNIRNKKASFEYHLLETFTAGMVLQGTEIKSIREGKASIAEAYCRFIGDELYVINMNISPYERGGFVNHEPKRNRKLLLQKKELKKLKRKLQDKGLTIIPLRLYIGKSGYAKLDIALARGKKLYDKRHDIKSRDTERAMKRNLL